MPTPSSRQPYQSLAQSFSGRFYDPRQDSLGLAAAQSYDDQRWNDIFTRDMMAPSFGMLPGPKTAVFANPGWSQFWGRLNDLERGADAQGYGFNADLVGKGPDTGTGIGSWKMREETGPKAGMTHSLSRNQSPASMRALLGAYQRQNG